MWKMDETGGNIHTKVTALKSYGGPVMYLNMALSKGPVGETWCKICVDSLATGSFLLLVAMAST